MPIFIRKNVEGRTDEEEASFQNFLKELRISIEICEPETFVKVKAHERLVNGKVVKIRSHYRRILGKGEKE
jgi:hypothetical protein